MEANLDLIAEGKQPYKAVLRHWWAGFSTDLNRAGSLIATAVKSHPEWTVLLDVPNVSGRTCPRCKTHLLRHVKTAKSPFIGCSGFPRCNYVESAPPTTPSSKSKEKR